MEESEKKVRKEQFPMEIMINMILIVLFTGVSAGVFLRRLTAGTLIASAVLVAVIGLLLWKDSVGTMIVVVLALLMLFSGRALWVEKDLPGTQKTK